MYTGRTLCCPLDSVRCGHHFLGGNQLKKHRLILAVVIAVALVGSTVAWYASQGGPPTTVATVQGTEIDQSEFSQQLENMYGEEALRTMIIYEIAMSAAEEQGLAPTEEDIDAEIDDILEQFGELGYSQFLAQYGMNDASFRYNLAISIALDNIRFAEIDTSEERLYEYFSDNREQFDYRDEVRASHILVPDEPSAWHMIDLLDEGADFGDLARMHSQDPGSAEQGGDLGFFGYNEMDPSFEDAAFGTDVGEISEPVESYAGFHVIKVTDRQEGRPAEFDEVKERVAEAFKETQARPGQEILDELRTEARVQIHKPEYAEVWGQ